MSRAKGDKPEHTSPSQSEADSDPKRISRRQFGRAAAVATAATLGAPALLAAHVGAAEPPASQEKKPEPLEGLSPQQVAEVDAKLANILRKYGTRFNADQRAHLRRILAQNERMMVPVRAFALQNGDPPASVLRISFNQAEAAHQKDER